MGKSARGLSRTSLVIGLIFSLLSWGGGSLSALAEGSLTGESSPPSTTFEPVSPEVTQALQHALSVKVVVTADELARSLSHIAVILNKLDPIGDSLFAGRLSAREVESLSDTGLVRVDLDSRIKLESDPAQLFRNSPHPVVQPSGLWDTEVSVPDTDPRLISTQQQVGIDGTGSVVAVIDTGVDSSAAGLANQVVHRVDFSTPQSSCSDNGFLDPQGHGTHVASIIAGTPGDYSTRNVRGIAPGAKIVDVRVFDCAAETADSEILSAIDWIINNKQTYGIDIVNMSLGSSGNYQTGLDSESIAVNRMVAAGLFVAVAAGNDGDKPGTIGSPGVAQFATTVGAASVSQYGAYQAFYSSTGPTGDGRAGIDLIAPGSGIEAAQTTALSGATTVKGGTSMATPYVAGIAALLKQQHPNEAPSGTTCTLGSGCESGVVTSSMTNPIQARMKTSDWYSTGIDNMSGAGLVSASATLLGENVPSAHSVSGQFRSDVVNTFRIGPHTGNALVSIFTPVSIRANAFDSSTLNIQSVTPEYVLKKSEVPCTKTSTSSCYTAAAYSFTPHLYSYLLRPSTEDTILQITSPRALDFEATFTGLTSTPTFASSISSSNVDLTSSSSGNITITRAVTSAQPTTFTVSAPANLSVAATVTLPAGTAGTSTSVAVSRTGQATHSEERIVFSGSDGSATASVARMRTTGNGRIVYPNSAGYSDRGENSDQYFIADDGTIYLNSRATGMQSSNGYDSIGVIPPGSLTIEPIQLVQTSASELDVAAISGDGTAFVGYQFPAGAGLLPGDSDTRENYFVYKRATSDLTEVGPDIKPFNVSTLLNSRYLMNEDGTQVAWSVTFPSGTDPVKLGWQGGTNFGTKRILASFPSTTTLQLVAMRGTHIVVKIKLDSSSPLHYRDYDANGNFRVIDLNGLTQTDEANNISPDGSAFAVLNGNSHLVECNDNGTRVPIENSYARSVGLANSMFIFSVANDCSWVMLNWTLDKSYPIGQFGRRLVKLYADDTMIELERVTADQRIGWKVDLTGSHFVRVSDEQLEHGDINGAWDYYRGLSGNSTSTVLGTPAQLTVETSDTFLQPGKPVSLMFSSDSSLPAVVTTNSTSLCSYANGKVSANTGSGTCVVTITVPSDSLKKGTTRTVSYTLMKGSRTSVDLAISGRTVAGYNEDVAITVVNNSGAQGFPSVSGPCYYSLGKVRTLSTAGICIFKYTLFATGTYNEYSVQHDIEISASSGTSNSSPSSSGISNGSPSSIATPVPTAAGVSPVSSTSVVMGVGKMKSNSAIASSAKLNVRSGSRVTVSIQKGSSTYCKKVGTSVKALKAGSCKLSVTVTPKQGKSITKTVVLKVR